VPRAPVSSTLLAGLPARNWRVLATMRAFWSSMLCRSARRIGCGWRTACSQPRPLLLRQRKALNESHAKNPSNSPLLGAACCCIAVPPACEKSGGAGRALGCARVPSCPAPAPVTRRSAFFAYPASRHLEPICRAGPKTTWRLPGQVFLQSCRGMASKPGQRLAGSVSAIWPGSRWQAGARRFFEANLKPYAILATATAAPMAWSPAITSPCCAAAGIGPRL
jgi:hypothetical protein